MNDLKKQLLGIGLTATAAEIDDLIAHATQKRLGPAEILEKIIATESADRARRSLERRMLRSRIGSFKPMADFDWNWPKKIDRPLVERALALEFLREGRNLILLGPNGVGKTMITRNIAYAAVQAGHSVLFRTAAEMIDDVSRDSPNCAARRAQHLCLPSGRSTTSSPSSTKSPANRSLPHGSTTCVARPPAPN